LCKQYRFFQMLYTNTAPFAANICTRL